MGRVSALFGVAVVVGRVSALFGVAVVVGRVGTSGLLTRGRGRGGGCCCRRGRLGAQPQRHIDGRLVVHHLVTQRHAVVAPRHQHLRGRHARELARQYRREAVDGTDELLQPRHGRRVDAVRLVK